MPLNTRPLVRAARLRSAFQQPQSPRVFLSTGSKLPGGTPGEASEQAMPLGPYYESILIKPQPVPDVKPEEPPTSSPKSPRSTVKKASARKPKESSSSSSSSNNTAGTSAPAAKAAPEPSAPPATAQEKARIIFGSRLAGPAERAERLEALRSKSTLIAGVLVPPRPEEPDNCCMSGCVNCVWDRYRDEMEEWAGASARAERALQAQRSQGPPEVLGSVSAVKGMQVGGLEEEGKNNAAMSMDDDGGGSETNWLQEDYLKKKTDRPKIAKDLWDDDLYKNVPVGIREFMKQEKKLKEKHAKEGTFGA